MYLSRLIVTAVALVIMTGPALADSKQYICHKGDTIKVSKSAVKSHKKHGDYIGKCRTPKKKTVVIMRCLNNNGALVVSGVSTSEGVNIDPPIKPRESCADAIADMMNMGYALERVNTGLTLGELGETEYMFFGKFR